MEIRWSFVRTVVVMLAALMFAGPSLATAEETDESMLDRKLDAYWGEKREIRTIQKRLFLKEKRWQFTVFGGVVPNDEFQTFVPMGGRLGYYITEDIGLEASGAYALASESELRSFLLDEFGEGGTTEIFLTQFLDWYGHVDFLWSPFHGKFGVFTSKLFHFDFYTAVGVGVQGLVVQFPNAPAESDIAIAGNVGLGAMMYVLDWMAIRIDYRHFIHENKAGDDLSSPLELSLGFAFFTPAPQ